MPMVSATCTQCGAALQVSSAKDTAVCNYCGTLFAWNQAIVNNGKEYFDVHAGILTKYNGSVENVVIPKGVFEIAARAFAGLTHLKRVTIPDSVLTIGEGAFWDCHNLAEVLIPSGVCAIRRNAFRETALESVVIPGSVLEIEPCAFSDCIQLRSVTLEEGVKQIGIYAFARCPSLSQIRVPKSLKAIHSNVFNWSHENVSLLCLHCGEKLTLPTPQCKNCSKPKDD